MSNVNETAAVGAEIVLTEEQKVFQAEKSSMVLAVQAASNLVGAIGVRLIRVAARAVAMEAKGMLK